MDHYKNPRNFGKIEDADLTNYENNPLCGDEIEVFIKLNSNKIENIKFDTKGCAISIATASILSEYLKGKDLNEVNKLKKEDILKMINVDLSISRIKCAMLSLVVVKNSLRKENDITN